MVLQTAMQLQVGLELTCYSSGSGDIATTNHRVVLLGTLPLAAPLRRFIRLGTLVYHYLHPCLW